ncbi:hypothetical protein TSH58p_06895 [Azospirillum sp. TSH58]|uniref:hypothetical protein n=1 Tax=Azospirillum sp. TSH58 TaxID=664962 RepID=UPI000D600ED8|nr:hypothetical protein [Azospirillum sp. TSH58]AWJ83279.1 hypothetical protein TSH58p_06895 [Azospirillum sp. TSH58]PWC80255.1 hypothetical protein TSH58_02625 [Azospirillum sp. TSH58]
MKSTLNICALALTCAIVPAVLTVEPAAASDKPAGGGGCPWAQDVKLDLNGKTLTLNQDAFSAKGEPLALEGYQIYPLLDQLKLRILGPRGQEWEAGLTRLSGGKRCQAFYVGKPFQVSDETGDHNSLILVR